MKIKRRKRKPANKKLGKFENYFAWAGLILGPTLLMAFAIAEFIRQMKGVCE
jgi:hypothetical protein